MECLQIMYILYELSCEDLCGWVRHVIDSCRVKAKVHQARAGLDMLKVGFSALLSPPTPLTPPPQKKNCFSRDGDFFLFNV
jgi:hypothetical protein